MADGILVTQGTQSTVATDDVGGTHYQVVKVDIGTNGVANPFAGTLPAVANLEKGTITRVEGGSIVVTSIPNVPGGTVGVVSSVTSVANLAAGTVTSVEGGSIVVTSIPNIPGGTVGVVSAVTSVTNLAGGTVTRVEGGSVAVTSVPNVPGGTIGVVSSVTSVANVAAGTITRVEGGSIAVTAGTVGTVANVAVVHNAGTIAALPNIPGGTMGMLNAGTITRVEQGSIQVTAGTSRLDARTTQNVLTYGTTFAGTAAGYGTLIGSASVGVGTYIWVNNVSITNPYGSVTCLIGMGTALNGTSVLLKGVYGTQTSVGHEKPFPSAVNAGMTNQDLVCYIGAAGTIDVNVSYVISA